MHTARDAAAAGPGRERAEFLPRIARIALGVAAVGALYRTVVAVVPSDATDARQKVDLLLPYGAIALAAVGLRWGIHRRAGIARWSAVAAGALMAAALVAGRGAVATFWHYHPMPLVDVSLFLVGPVVTIGFVVAGICCAVARSDASGWR